MDELMYEATPFHEELELYSHYLEGKNKYVYEETPIEDSVSDIINEFNLRFGRNLSKVLNWLHFMEAIQPGKDTQMEPWISQPHMKNFDLSNIPSISDN